MLDHLGPINVSSVVFSDTIGEEMLKYRFILLAMICSASQLEHIYFLTVKKVLPCSAGTFRRLALLMSRLGGLHSLALRASLAKSSATEGRRRTRDQS